MVRYLGVSRGTRLNLYFEVEDYFLYDANDTVEVTVVYFDAGPAAFCIQYDSADPALSGIAQRFRDGPGQAIAGSETWREVKFTIPHARFAGRANGADFRLACRGGELAVAEVTLRRAHDE